MAKHVHRTLLTLPNCAALLADPLTTVGYDPRSINIEELETIIPQIRSNSYQFNE